MGRMDELLCSCVREGMWKAENDELKRVIMEDEKVKSYADKPTQTEATITIAQLKKQVSDLQRQLYQVQQRPSEAAGNARVLTVLEQACTWFDKHQRVFGLVAPPFWYDEAKIHLER